MVAASIDTNRQGIRSVDGEGMVQVIVDTDISSPNGKLSTHSLAMILTQPVNDQAVPLHETIPRLGCTAIKLPIYDDGDEENIVHFEVQKKPPMPDMPGYILTDEQNTKESSSGDRFPVLQGNCRF